MFPQSGPFSVIIGALSLEPSPLQMRRALLAVILAVLALLPAPLQAQDLRLLRFRHYLEALRQQAGIPGLAAAIVSGGDIVWEHAFGQQNVERAVPMRTDTPFRVDGLTEILTSALVLRCVEEGRISLDDPIDAFTPAEESRAGAGGSSSLTLRDILLHATGDAAPERPGFAYAPERLNRLTPVIERCAGEPLLGAFANLLDRFAMFDSVPGTDVVRLEPDPDVAPGPEALERYARVLERLATPYAVDQRGRPTPAPGTLAPLQPATGLVSTVRDLAGFITALRQGLLLRPETLVAAWTPPVGADGLPLPHGLGWFVHAHNGETVVWQFGLGNNASSSLLVSVPARGITLVLLANSSGLVKPFPLAAGDLTSSPFGRLFLEMFVR